MVFEVGRPIGHNGITHRVGLIEGIVCKVVDLVIDRVGRLLIDAVGHTALDTPALVTVDKGVALRLDLLRVLLGDGTAHHICAAQRVTRQLLEDHHDLLLIHNAAIGV